MGRFTRAEKSKSLLRLALFGPSGSGKTYTSLMIASGIAEKISGKIALIDSERGSASKYADLVDFDTVDLEKKDINEYVGCMRDAAAEGYKVLIIDSLSHAWSELLTEIDKIAQAKYKGNTWSAWNEGTPKQKALVDAILSFPGHIIATMRTKTEWIVDTSSGKTRPQKVGLAPEQGKGIEYEFDMLGEVSPEHIMYISKDRTSKFQDQYIDKPGKRFGGELVDWLNSPSRPVKETKFEAEIPEAPPARQTAPPAAPPPAKKISETLKKRIHATGTKMYNGEWDAKRHALVKHISKNRAESLNDLTDDEAKQLITAMENKLNDPEFKRYLELRETITGIPDGITFSESAQKLQTEINLLNNALQKQELHDRLLKKGSELGVSQNILMEMI